MCSPSQASPCLISTQKLTIRMSIFEFTYCSQNHSESVRKLAVAIICDRARLSEGVLEVTTSVLVMAFHGHVTSCRGATDSLCKLVLSRSKTSE